MLDSLPISTPNIVLLTTIIEKNLLLDVGWQELTRVYYCFIHLDIKDGKIWIQRNLTEVDIAQKFVEMNVPHEDIVLGLHPPYKRPYSEYGVA